MQITIAINIFVSNMIQYEIICIDSSHEPFKPQLENCLSLFDHFVVLALKGLSFLRLISNGLNGVNINSLTYIMPSL